MGIKLTGLIRKTDIWNLKVLNRNIFWQKFQKNWKTKFSFSEFLCTLKVPWAMWTFALEQNFLHFSTLLYAWTNISYANFDCSKFCQMRYPRVGRPIGYKKLLSMIVKLDKRFWPNPETTNWQLAPTMTK